MPHRLSAPILLLAVGLAVASFGAASVRGDTISWVNPAGGLFSAPGNWAGGVAPGAMDRAEFNSAAAYTVTFSQAVFIERFVVRNDVLAINLAGFTWTLTDPTSVRIGFFSTDTAVVNVGPGAAGTIACESTSIGGFAGSSGDLTLAGNNVVWDCAGDVVVGDGGTGTLDVSNNATLLVGGDLIVANALSSTGTVIVSGQNTDLTASGSIVIAPDAFVRSDDEAPAERGAADERGSLFLTSDASISAATVEIGRGGFVTGDGAIDATLVTNAGRLSPGPGTEVFVVFGDYEQTTTGGLPLQIAGINAGAQHDQLFVTGSCQLDGRVTITLNPAFTPVVGNSISLVRAATIAGQFSEVQMPTPPEGLDFEIRYEATRVNFVVVAATLFGDLNGDGVLSGADLAILLGSWGACPDPPLVCAADLNNDNIVNAFDLGFLLGAWGAS